MDKVRIIHDTVGQTLTIWFDDPARESVCEETSDEVILMKDAEGRVFGIEVLHFRPDADPQGLTVEAIVRTHG